MASRRPGSERRRPDAPAHDRAASPSAIVRAGRGLAVALAVASATGCTYTVAGDKPAAIEPWPPPVPPAVEYTVAEFSFALGSGDMAASIVDGRQLSREIMQSWRERGYVSSEQYVADGAFSGTADYHLTLRGSQRGETSFFMQVLNVLTLSLSPYTITQQYEFQFLLDDATSGTEYAATIQATDKTWVEPFLILTLPWAARGHRATMKRVGDSLYEEFRRQGALPAGLTGQTDLVCGVADVDPDLRDPHAASPPPDVATSPPSEAAIPVP